MMQSHPFSSLIYKICPRDLWNEAQALGRFEGAPVDLADGYIHFSAAEQVKETAARHFKGEEDLVLIAVSPDSLDPSALRWEVSRGGSLFPHLYAALPLDAVHWGRPLPLGPDGHHIFPDLA